MKNILKTLKQALLLKNKKTVCIVLFLYAGFAEAKAGFKELLAEFSQNNDSSIIGLNIERLDHSFSKLPQKEKNTHFPDYVKMRNALFIKGHSARLDEELKTLKQNEENLKKSKNERSWLFNANQIAYNSKKEAWNGLKRVIALHRENNNSVLFSPGQLHDNAGNLQTIDDLNTACLERLNEKTCAKEVSKLYSELAQSMSLTQKEKKFSPSFQARFLKEQALTLKQLPKEHIPHIDLSSRFTEPQRQGSSYACVAMSMVSDAEYVLNQPTVDLKEWYAYVEIANDQYRSSHRGTHGRLFQNADCSTESSHLLSFAQQVQLSLLLDDTYKTLTTQPALCDERTQQTYVVSKYFNYDFIKLKLNPKKRYLSLDLVYTLLENELPPQIAIEGNAQEETEDWMRLIFDPKYQSISHIFMIVGMGEGVDPFDLKKKAYFLIRDSMGKEYQHYKVDAQSILDHALALSKILEVKPFEKK